MKNIKFFTLPAILFLWQAISFTLNAQACTPTITNVSTTVSTCTANGSITATIGGSNVNPSAGVQYTLRRSNGTFEVGPAWAIWAGSGNTRTHPNLAPGTYDLEIRVFCSDADWSTTTAFRGGIVVTGNYNSTSAGCGTVVHATCGRANGSIPVTWTNGKAPFTVTWTGTNGGSSGSTGGLTGSPYTIPNLPAGTYTVRVVDDCSYTANACSGTVINNTIPSSITHPYSAVMERASGCNVVRPYTSSTITDLQYCYSTSATPPASNSSLWIACTSYPTYTLPATDFKTFCSSGGRLYSHVRSTCNTALAPVTREHTFTSYVCLSDYAAAISVGTWVGGTTCDIATTTVSITSTYGLCYPVTWAITEKGGAPVSNGTLATTGGTIASSTTSFTRDVTYVVTCTDNSGIAFTREFTPPAATAKTYTGTFLPAAPGYTCTTFGTRYLRITPSPSYFYPGTTVRYQSGPMTLGMGAVGTTITITSASQTYHYPTTSGVGSSATYMDLVDGTYRFIVTPPAGCGSPETIDIVVTGRASTYDPNNQDFTVDYVGRTCQGVGIRMNGSIRLKGGGTATAYFRIQGNTVDQLSVASGTVVNLPPSNTPYTVSMYPSSYTCPMVSKSVPVTANGLRLDYDSTSAYACQEATTGRIRVQALDGVAPFSYRVVNDPEDPSTPFEDQTSTTGLFTNIGVPGGNYIITVSDDCGSNFPLKINMLDLSNINVTYAPNSGIFCEGTMVQINCYSLGITQYEWRRLDDLSTVISTDQKPRFICEFPASTGVYQVTVQPEGCGFPKVDTLSVTAVQGPVELPAIPNPNISLCIGPSPVNIVQLSGVTASSGCTLKYYPSLEAQTGEEVTPPTAFVASTAGTYTYYVTQVLNATGCESPRKTIVVTVTTGTTPVVSVTPNPVCLGATATLSPASGGTWVSDNTAIATVSGATVTPVASGSTTFTFMADGGCLAQTTALTVNVGVQKPTASVNCNVSPAGTANITITAPVGSEYEYSLNGGAYGSSPTFTDLPNDVDPYIIKVRNATTLCASDTIQRIVDCTCLDSSVVIIGKPVSSSTCHTQPITATVTLTGSASQVTLESDGDGTITPDTPITTKNTPVTFTYTPDPADANKTIRITATTNNPLGAPCIIDTASWDIFVYPIFSAGSINTSGVSVCSDDKAIRNIGSATDASGGYGTITYQWYRNGIEISSTNVASYDIPEADRVNDGTNDVVITYTRGAKDATCVSDFVLSSGSYQLTVYPSFKPGAITPGNPFVCSGNTSPMQIGSAIDASGGYGTITYEWYKNGAPIASSNSPTYNIPPEDRENIGTSNVVIEYTRKAKDATCQTTFTGTTDVYTLTVYPSFKAGSITTGASAVCSSDASTIQISSAIDASGGYGTITYQWYKNDAEISSSNSPNYNIPPEDRINTSGSDATIVYTRKAKDATCESAFVESSNSYTLTVYASFKPGTITTDNPFVCSGNTSTMRISSVADAANGHGTITYEWYKNDSPIASSNNAFYDIPEADRINEGTNNVVIEYTRKAKDATCQTTLTGSAGVYTLTVYPSFKPGAIKVDSIMVCSGDDASRTIGNAIIASGGYGTITYEWYKNGVAIPGSNAETYVIPTDDRDNISTSTTIIYTRKAKDATCQTTFADSKGEYKLVVNPYSTLDRKLLNSVVPDTICSGDIVKLVTSAPDVINPIYRWYASTNPGASPIQEGPDSTYTPLPESLIVTPEQGMMTYPFYVGVSGDNFCEGIGSTGRDTIFLTIRPYFESRLLIPTDSTICSGGSAELKVAIVSSFTVYNPVYKWYANATATTPVATGPTYSPSDDLELVSVSGLTPYPYYVAVKGNNFCENHPNDRTVAKVNVKAISGPKDITIAGISGVCGTDGTTLEASASSVINPVFKWYSNAEGGAPFYTGSEYKTSALKADTTFYLSVSGSNYCEGSIRDTIEVTIACFTIHGTVFPLVFLGDDEIDRLFNIRARLYAAPPPGMGDPIAYLRRVRPLHDTIAVHYDGSVHVPKTPKNPGYSGSLLNPGYPINWEIINKIPDPGMEKDTVTLRFGERAANSVGHYTFEDVAPGNYVLTLSRPGFITRYAQVTVVSGGTPFIEHRELIGGDVNNSSSIDVLDINAINYRLGYAYGDAGYDAQYDINGNTEIEIGDISLVKSFQGFHIQGYTDTDEWIEEYYQQ